MDDQAELDIPVIAESFRRQSDSYLALANSYIRNTNTLKRIAAVQAVLSAVVVLIICSVFFVTIDNKNDTLGILACDRQVEIEYRNLSVDLDSDRAGYILSRDEYNADPTEEKRNAFLEAKEKYEAAGQAMEHFDKTATDCGELTG